MSVLRPTLGWTISLPQTVQANGSQCGTAESRSVSAAAAGQQITQRTRRTGQPNVVQGWGVRAVALTAEGGLEVVDKDEPAPGPDDAVVAVSRAGICGSDLHLKASGLLPAGAVMGHEASGTIAALGAQAPGHLNLGQPVTVLPARRCGTCAACRSGRSHLCPDQARTAIGLGRNDGAFAERVRVPAGSCHPLPDGVGFESGALVEPYAVGLHAVRRSRAGTDPSVAVGILGAGTIGLMCMAALRQAGVQHVVVAEPNPTRSAVARAMGARVVEDATLLSSGGVLDVIFDAAGGPDTAAVALQAVRAGGQVVLVGVADSTLALPGGVLVVKEVDVVPSMSYTDDEFVAALAGVAAGAVDVDLVAPDVRPLAAASASFDDLTRADAPAKVMLAP